VTVALSLRGDEAEDGLCDNQKRLNVLFWNLVDGLTSIFLTYCDNTSLAMRLTDQQLAIIKTTASQVFGEATGVWLFGSRVNDNARGGDIDLYIEPPIEDVDALVEAKLRFMMEMHKKMGEQKIDVVIRRPQSEADLPIYRVAKQTGVKLS